MSPSSRSCGEPPRSWSWCSCSGRWKLAKDQPRQVQAEGLRGQEHSAPSKVLCSLGEKEASPSFHTTGDGAEQQKLVLWWLLGRGLEGREGGIDPLPVCYKGAHSVPDYSKPIPMFCMSSVGKTLTSVSSLSSFYAVPRPGPAAYLLRKVRVAGRWLPLALLPGQPRENPPPRRPWTSMRELGDVSPRGVSESCILILRFLLGPCVHVQPRR